jgi:hypothetical protein
MSALVDSCRQAGTAVKEGDRAKLQEAIRSIASNGAGGVKMTSAASLGELSPSQGAGAKKANDNTQNDNSVRGRQLESQRSLGHSR